MRLLQDALTATGRDAVFVLHRIKRTDASTGQTRDDYSISQTERERLARSTNAWIELAVDEERGKRYARVVFSRAGRKGVVVFDEEGRWRGVPERIEAELYG